MTQIIITILKMKKQIFTDISVSRLITAAAEEVGAY